MLDSYKIEEFIYQHCDQVAPKTGGWIMRCPICGDSRTKPNVKRFHLDYFSKANEYTYFCYRCGESGDVYNLYSYLVGVKYEEAKKELKENKYSPQKVMSRLDKKDIIIKKEKEELQELDLSPYGLISVNDHTDSIRGKRYQQKLKDFLKTRKIDIDCQVATKGRFEGRIIIPLYVENKLVYFQGRRVTSTMEPKYLNPSIDKSLLIPNIEHLNPSEDVIITEGILDMYSIQKQSTCCLGSYISDDFIHIILDKIDANIIVALDNYKMDTAAKNQLLKILQESKYASVLKYFIMPYQDVKDLNQLKQEHNIEDMYQFVLNNSWSYLKMRTMLKLLT
jgi:DNA primase